MYQDTICILEHNNIDVTECQYAIGLFRQAPFDMCALYRVH